MINSHHGIYIVPHQIMEHSTLLLFTTQLHNYYIQAILLIYVRVIRVCFGVPEIKEISYILQGRVNVVRHSTVKLRI